MTDELKARIAEGFTSFTEMNSKAYKWQQALLAVVELHKPKTVGTGAIPTYCTECIGLYPCPTIQAIEKEQPT